MHSESLVKYLEHPELLDEATLTDLVHLRDNYPYFQTAHMLFLKNQHNIKSLDFNDHLRLSAAFNSDRSLLYRLINLPFRIVHRREEGSADSLTVTDGDRVPVYELIPDDKPPVARDTVSVTGTDITLPDAATAGARPGLDKTDGEQDRERQLHSFTGWLEQLHSGGEDQQIPQGTEPEYSQTWLINEFISKQPSMKARQEPTDGIKDISEKNTGADEHLLTETLARIYLRQGYFEKAINTYEKLSLKYPEKSS